MSATLLRTPARGSFVKTACVLWVAGILGAMLVLPYVTELEASAIGAAAVKTGFPPAILLALSVFQAAILLAIAVFAGLWAARKLGLSMPIVDALLSRQHVPPQIRKLLVPAVGLGVLVGIVIVVLDQRVFPPLISGKGNLFTEPAAWKGLLASFYGAIDEELLLRLGMLSLVALMLQRLLRLLGPTGDVLQPGPFWAANVFTAIVFGVGHLPATAALAPLSTIVIARALVLNGVAGIAFGWLYWQRGLEAAMLAHFAADLVLHVLTALFR
jgi:hypothetical protein